MTDLPSFGEPLRRFLANPAIKAEDLSRLLRRRGVFVSEQTTKEELVELIALAFVTPTEIEALRKVAGAS